MRIDALSCIPTGRKHCYDAASGTAILQLSDDQTSATLSFRCSNLTSPLTAVHVHGPADPGETGAPILFDLDTATFQPDGTYIWVLTPNALDSVQDIVGAIPIRSDLFRDYYRDIS